MGDKYTGFETVGEIVADFPGASNLFKENRIDFCCGGDRPLFTALRHQKLEESSFIDKLNQMYVGSKKSIEADIHWRDVSNSDLIDFIVSRHHVYLRKELPLLSEFVSKIHRVHGVNHGEVLTKLDRYFHYMKTELENHLIAEEETVFPLIKQYHTHRNSMLWNQIIDGIYELETDHKGVGDFLKEMRAVTDDYRLPTDACRTYTLAFQKLEELEADLFQHIHLENNILFFRFSKKDIKLNSN